MKNKYKGKKYIDSKKQSFNDAILPYQGIKSYVKSLCHVGFCKVHDYLMVGSKLDLTEDTLSKIDVIVSLSSLNGKIWDKGYRKDIIYFPITDFDILPIDAESLLVKKIMICIEEKKMVAICCDGGHGRTGYIASLVLHELGIKDPIEYLRAKYCENAVESLEQLEAIACYTNNLELIDIYKKSVDNPFFGKTISTQSDYYKSLMLSPYKPNDHTPSTIDEKCCGSCIICVNYVCGKSGDIRYPTDKACSDHASFDEFD